MTERTHYVYTAYDAEGRALYVGCTKNPSQRRSAHLSGSGQSRCGWFGAYVKRWRVTGPLPKVAAYALERRRTAELQPPFNGYSAGNRVRDKWGTYQPLAMRAYVAEQEAKSAA